MMKTMAMSVILLGWIVAPVPGQELLYNPGFEDLDGNGSYGDGWGSFGAAGFHAFFGANGHASLFMDNPGNSGGVFPTGIAGGAGASYRLNLLDVRIEENADANLRIGLEYYEGDDSTKVAEEIVPIPRTVTGDGLFFSMSGTAPSGTVFVRPMVLFDDVRSTASSQENVFVFDASLKVVPEPVPLMLLAGAAVCLRKVRKCGRRSGLRKQRFL